jgi:hypothetical protein
MTRPPIMMFSPVFRALGVPEAIIPPPKLGLRCLSIVNMQ